MFYAVPLMFEYEPHEDRWLSEFLLLNLNLNKNIYRMKLSNLGKSSIFRWIYVLINALGVYVIPLTIIVILNQKLLLSIRLLKQRSAEYNAPLPTKQGIRKKIISNSLVRNNLRLLYIVHLTRDKFLRYKSK